MIRIKSATDAPNFKSPSRHTEGGLKDKQMDDFILIMGLIQDHKANEGWGNLTKPRYLNKGF
jgi:hypothetical protein